MGNEFVSNKNDFDFNKYWSTRNKKNVIAARLFIGSGIGDLSFQQQYIVGTGSGGDIRGYTQGTYRGDQLYAVTGEYRWNFHKTLSAVGFFGLATVTNSFNEDHNGLILPGIGTGFRVNVAPEYHMNVGMDIAAGKDDWGLYFRIGEAF
jgi:hemolysin activation/secretion protein